MAQGNEVPPISILVLAAGASSRMRGADKLMEPVAGQPLLRHVVQLALGTGADVLVALPPDNSMRRTALNGLTATCLDVVSQAMGASLRHGIATLPENHAVMVLLADMPEIDASDIATMVAAYRTAPTLIHRATAQDGTPGHPVIFPPWVRPSLLALQDDSGAKAVLVQYADQLRNVALPDTHATTDLDTPEDWAAWRAT